LPEQAPRPTGLCLPQQHAVSAAVHSGVRVRIAELTACLQAHPRTERLRQYLEDRMLHWRERHHVAAYAWALEVCAATWAESGEVRVHAHAFLRADAKLRVRTADELALLGSRPFKSQCVGTSGRKDRLSNQGLYYVQAPKRGSVARGGNILPFQDYLVNGEWVMNLLQQQKLEFQSARAELVKVGKNLPRLLQCLDKWEQEHENARLQGRIADIMAELNADKKPFRRIPEVEEWLAQYTKNRMRYRFLVLEGPSGLGKTQFSLSLSPGSMEVTCSNCDEPDLREFKPMQHDLILLDEATTTLVLKCKKLMQAGAAWVSLGSSSTNMYAYKIWAHKVRFIVSTNTWSHELTRCAAADRDWLVANCVHVRVSAPLFEQ